MTVKSAAQTRQLVFTIGNRVSDSQRPIATASAAASIGGMDTETTAPQPITLGPIVLRQVEGQLFAHHKALREPIIIDPKQLQRWLMRQVRDQVVVAL